MKVNTMRQPVTSQLRYHNELTDSSEFNITSTTFSCCQCETTVNSRWLVGV